MTYQFARHLNPTIRDTKKALAASFPGVEFSIEKGRRGQRYLIWTGGPAADAVMLALLGKRPDDLILNRRNTEAEQAAENAANLIRWAAEEAAYEADAPARAAAALQRKADGAAKRAATQAAKRDLAAKLAAAFPGVEFSMTQIRGCPYFEWSGGPLPEAVAAITGGRGWAHTRRETAAETAERHALQARRLAAKAAREAAKAIRAAEREAARAAILGGLRQALPGPRRARLLAPFLPMALPHVLPVIAGMVQVSLSRRVFAR